MGIASLLCTLSGASDPRLMEACACGVQCCSSSTCDTRAAGRAQQTQCAQLLREGEEESGLGKTSGYLSI